MKGIKEALKIIEESILNLKITSITQDPCDEDIFIFTNEKKGLKGSIDLNKKEIILKTKIK